MQSSSLPTSVTLLLGVLAGVTLMLAAAHWQSPPPVAPLSEGKLIASRIPGARMITFDSDSHLPLEGEQPVNKPLCLT